MNPRVETVVPNSKNYTLTLGFTNQELRQFDVKPYLSQGFFKELQDRAYFNSARVALGSVEWPNGQDFCPDTLYELSEPMTEADTVLDTMR